MIFLNDIKENIIADFANRWGFIKKLSEVEGGLVKRGNKTFFRNSFKRNQWQKQVQTFNKKLKQKEIKRKGDDYYHPIYFEGYTASRKPEKILKSQLIDKDDISVVNKEVEDLYALAAKRGSSPHHREFGKAIYKHKFKGSFKTSDAVEGETTRVAYKVDAADFFYKEVIHFHTHPAASTFSPMDLNAAIEIKKGKGFEKVKEVVTNNRGSIFIAVPTFKGLSIDNIEEFYEEGFDKTIKEIIKKFGSKEKFREVFPDTNDRIFIQTHKVNKILSQDYRFFDYEEHLSKRDAAALKRFESWNNTTT